MGVKRARDESEAEKCAEAGGGDAKVARVGEELSKAARTELGELVTFWFSGPNLRKDKFLAAAVGPGGWVAVGVFLAFNKVKGLAVGEGAFVDVCRGLPGVEIGVVEGGCEVAVRVAGGVEEVARRVREAGVREDERTVYLKGLPREVEVKDVEGAVGACGRVLFCRVVKGAGGKFGFVEFESVENAAACLRQFAVRGGEGRFERMRAYSKEFWRVEKAQREAEKKRRAAWKLAAQKAAAAGSMTGDAAAGESDVDDGGASNDVSWLPKQLRDLSNFENYDGIVVGSRSARPTAAADACSPAVTPPAPHTAFSKGLVIAVSGLKPAADVKRSTLFQALEEHGPLAYVEYTPAQPDVCRARYHHISGVRRALAAPAKLLGADVTLRTLTGAEEAAYYTRVAAQRAAKKVVKPPVAPNTHRRFGGSDED